MDTFGNLIFDIRLNRDCHVRDIFYHNSTLRELDWIEQL